MKIWLLILWSGLSLRAATTNYVAVVGNVMQGPDLEFSIINPTDLDCVTGGLVTNGSPGIFLKLISVNAQGVMGASSIVQAWNGGFTNITYLHTCCTNQLAVDALTALWTATPSFLPAGSYADPINVITNEATISDFWVTAYLHACTGIGCADPAPPGTYLMFHVTYPCTNTLARTVSIPYNWLEENGYFTAFVSNSVASGFDFYMTITNAFYFSSGSMFHFITTN